MLSVIIFWEICSEQACGRKEEVRYLLWIRLIRVRRVTHFFRSLEKDIRINYMFTRIVKLLAVELYCTHTAACIFYYLATTLPPAQEGYTWIGSLKIGDYSYSHFREIDFWKRYLTSLYFAIVTMATVGKFFFFYLFLFLSKLLLYQIQPEVLWFCDVHFVYQLISCIILYSRKLLKWSWGSKIV